MTKTTELYLNGARVAELWAAIQEELGQKADVSGSYATPESVAAAITEALAGYATNDSVSAAITAALTDYLTAAEVETAIAAAVVDAAGIRFQAVDVLPETGEQNVIYLVASEQEDVRKQYMWIGGKFELLGSTAVNLTGYWGKDELRAMTAEELQAILV